MYLADNSVVERLLCVYLVSPVVAIVLAGRRFSEGGGEACECFSNVFFHAFPTLSSSQEECGARWCAF